MYCKFMLLDLTPADLTTRYQAAPCIKKTIQFYWA